MSLMQEWHREDVVRWKVLGTSQCWKLFFNVNYLFVKNTFKEIRRCTTAYETLFYYCNINHNFYHTWIPSHDSAPRLRRALVRPAPTSMTSCSVPLCNLCSKYLDHHFRLPAPTNQPAARKHTSFYCSFLPWMCLSTAKRQTHNPINGLESFFFCCNVGVKLLPATKGRGRGGSAVECVWRIGYILSSSSSCTAFIRRVWWWWWWSFPASPADFAVSLAVRSRCTEIHSRPSVRSLSLSRLAGDPAMVVKFDHQ